MTQHSIDELRFSTNPKYQAAYYELRNQTLKKAFDMPKHDFGEDKYDNKRDSIYVINKDDVCVAGARLITRGKNKLPAEDFMDLQQHFGLPTNQNLNNICEFSRLVVNEQYRSMSLLIKILKAFTEHAKKLRKTKIIYCSSKNKVHMFKGLFKRRMGYQSLINDTLFYYGQQDKTPLTSGLTLLN